MRSKAAILFMLLGTTSCLQFFDECMPKDSLEAYIKGSEMKLRVWVPETDDTSLLTLISANSQTGISRRIIIRKSEIIVQARDATSVIPKQELPIQNKSLPHGWVTFKVTSDENFTVSVPDANLALIDIPDVVQGKNIKIRGSYVTVNCKLPANQWEVSAAQEAIIPLGLEGLHNFSLFSRAHFLPELAVGLGSLEPLGIPLSSVFELESKQMDAFKLYNFTLDCTIDETGSSCYFKAGKSKVLVGSLPREATSLSLKAGGTDDYIIVHDIGKDQKGERTGDQSEDEKGGGPCPQLMVVYPIVVSVTFIVTLLTKCLIMKRRQTRPEKLLSLTDHGGDEKRRQTRLEKLLSLIGLGGDEKKK